MHSQETGMIWTWVSEERQPELFFFSYYSTNIVSSYTYYSSMQYFGRARQHRAAISMQQCLQQRPGRRQCWHLRLQDSQRSTSEMRNPLIFLRDIWQKKPPHLWLCCARWSQPGSLAGSRPGSWAGSWACWSWRSCHCWSSAEGSQWWAPSSSGLDCWGSTNKTASGRPQGLRCRPQLPDSCTVSR